MEALEILDWLDSKDIEIYRDDGFIRVNAKPSSLNDKLLDRIMANRGILEGWLRRPSKQYVKGFMDAVHENYDRMEQREAGRQLCGSNEIQLSESTIERAIRLCHPDKHANSKASNEVTQELLRVRGGQRHERG